MAASDTIRLTYTAEIKDLKKRLAEIPEVTAAEARKMVNELNKSVKSVERGQDRIAKASQKAGKSISTNMSSINASVNRAAIGFAALGTAAVAALGVASLSVGSEFESQMAKVQAVTGATSEEMARLEKKSRDMGKTTLFSATQSAQGIEELGKAGLTTSESITALDSALFFAGATGQEINESSTVLVSTMKQFGLEASDATRITDVFSLSMRTSLFDAESLSEAMKKAGTTGSGFGMTLEETTAALAAFADLGLAGSVIGTNFNSMMIAAAKGTQQSAAALKKYGLVQDDINPELHTAGELLQIVADHSITAGDSIRIFGTKAGANIAKIGESIRSGKTDIEGYTAALVDSAGTTAKAYDIILDTVSARMQIVGSSAQDLLITIFDSYAAPLTEVLDEIPAFIGQVTTAFEASSDEIEALTGEALGNLSDWLKNEGPQFAEFAADTAVAIAEVSVELSKVLPYLKDISILVGTAFAAAKVYQMAKAVKAATLAIRAFGVSGVAAMGPVGIAIAGTAAAAATLMIIFDGMEKKIIAQERRAMSSGQERLNLIDAEMAALDKREKQIEMSLILNGRLRENDAKQKKALVEWEWAAQAATAVFGEKNAKNAKDLQMKEMAGIIRKQQLLGYERQNEVESMEARAAHTAELKEQQKAAEKLAKELGKPIVIPTFSGDGPEGPEGPEDNTEQIKAQEQLAAMAQRASDATLTASQLIQIEREREIDQLMELGKVSGDMALAEVAAADVRAEAEVRLADLRTELAKRQDAERQAALDASMAADAELYDAKVSLAQSSLGTIESLARRASQAEGEHAMLSFVIAQASAVSQIAINTIVAASRSLAELGPIAGPIAAVGMGIAGAGQAAAVLSESPPSFYTGGFTSAAQSPDAIPATLHPDEAVLNKTGRKEMGDDAIRRANRGQSDSTPSMTFRVDGREFGSISARQARQGGRLSEELTRRSGRLGRRAR